MNSIFEGGVLSAEDEEAAIAAWVNNKDQKAFTSLLPTYKQVFARLWRRYNHIPKEDIQQALVLALDRACHKWDPNYGHRLVTLARWWAFMEVQRLSIHQRSIGMQKTTNKPGQIHQPRLPSLISLSVLDSDADEDQSTIAWILSNDNLVTDCDEIEEDASYSLLKKVTIDFLDTLDDRKADIFLKRVYNPFEELEVPLTLEQLGEEYGITRERIRQLERDVLIKFKKTLIRAGIRSVHDVF